MLLENKGPTGLVEVIGSLTWLERGAQVKTGDRAKRLTEFGLKAGGAGGRGDGMVGERGGHAIGTSVDIVAASGIVAVHVISRTPWLLLAVLY